MLSLSRSSFTLRKANTFLLKKAFSTTTSRLNKESSKLYELRTYFIQPSKLSSFVQLTNDKLHLRTAHSKLLGYWTCELGGLNQVIHLWEYDNYAQRTKVRQTLSQDKEWIQAFVSPAFPMIDKQDNVTLSLLPWTPLNEESGNGPRVFELSCHTIRPGRLTQWEHLIRQGWGARMRYSKPVGFWKTHYGPSHNVYELWAYGSFDERDEIVKKTFEDEEWRDTVGQAILYTESSWMKGLAPVAISPLK